MNKNALAHPATSCHQAYIMPEESKTSQDWELRNTVNVTESHRTTFFMAIGFFPGYSGIQEREPWMTKVAIFSLWHKGDDKVELLEQGENVRVTGFGGEGTGLKTLMDLDWEKGEPVEFKVRGRKVDGAWEVSCHVYHRGEAYFMSKYRRKGRIDPSGFWSFVEDWHTKPGGHLLGRRAEFSNPTVTLHDLGYFERLIESRFTKSLSERDLFASNKTIGGAKQDPVSKNAVFFLETGGEEPGPGYMANYTPLRCSRCRSNKQTTLHS